MPENALRRRVRFIPFWHLTQWGFIRNCMFGPVLHVNNGCDEWHNKSRFIIIPLIGEIVVFRKEGFDRSGEEHLYASGPDGTEGRIVEGCEICDEILEGFHS